MTATLQCPQCQAVHAIKPQMAGTRAQCGCGNVLNVPRPKTAADERIEVSCPGCDKKYFPNKSLAGKAVKCTACGTTLKVPAMTAAIKSSDNGVASLLDEWQSEQDETQSVRDHEKLVQAHSTDVRQELTHGDILTIVINRMSAGYCEEELIEELIEMGVPDTEAARIVETVIPPKGFTSSNSSFGFAHIIIGVTIIGVAGGCWTFEAEITEVLGGKYPIIPIGLGILGFLWASFGLLCLSRKVQA